MYGLSMQNEFQLESYSPRFPIFDIYPISPDAILEKQMIYLFSYSAFHE